MPTPGAGATVLESALAALFGGETVAGVKGRRNVEVSGNEAHTCTAALTNLLLLVCFHALLLFVCVCFFFVTRITLLRCCAVYSYYTDSE